MQIPIDYNYSPSQLKIIGDVRDEVRIIRENEAIENCKLSDDEIIAALEKERQAFSDWQGTLKGEQKTSVELQHEARKERE